MTLPRRVPTQRLGGGKRVLLLVVCAVVLVVVSILFERSGLGDAVLRQQWALNQVHFFEVRDKLRVRRSAPVKFGYKFAAEASTLETPLASPLSGFYDSDVLAELTGALGGGEVRYTLDGSIPTQRSSLYTEPVRLTETTVLRARSFSYGRLASDTVTRTYLVREPVQLPVVSVVADPANLFNTKAGIYARYEGRGRRWQRSGVVEYFKPNEKGPGAPPRRVSTPAELRIHGGFTRKRSKKSMRFEYSTALVDGDPDMGWRDVAAGSSTRAMVLRNGGNRPRIGMRDKLFQNWYAEVAPLVSTPGPCVLLINGKYWGLYDLRERIGEEFFARKLGKGNYDILRFVSFDPDVVSGGAEHWRLTLGYFKENSLTDAESLRRAGELLDLDNWTDYILFNVYASHQDWPAGNMTLFRPRDGSDRRWRVFAWDADSTFSSDNPLAAAYGAGPTHDTLGWALRTEVLPQRPPHETLIFRRLLENSDYRRTFALRYCDLLNTSFQPQRLEKHLDALLAEVRHELPRDWARWETSDTVYWEDIESIRKFIRERPGFATAHVRKHLSLGPLRTIRLSQAGTGQGNIRVNSIEISEFPWEGTYFGDLPFTIQALPAPGSEFVGWADAEPETSTRRTVRLTEDVVELEARFR